MSIDPTSDKYVFDPESGVEMARLIEQDRIMTKAMGGPLTDIVDHTQLHQVLDLACGPGSWVLDMAFEYPDIEVAGVDISQTMITYANARARTQSLSNASFGVMDISQPLDFADASFDLVNARMLFGVLSRQSWPRFVAECTRILRPGGMLRLTEPVNIGESNSPAQDKLSSLFIQAIWRAGYGFSTQGQQIGITYMLPRFLRNAGFQNIQHHAYTLDFSADTEHWIDQYHNSELAYEGTKPLLVKLGLVTQEEIDSLCQQALTEMQKHDFTALGYFFSVWGQKP